MVKRGVTGPLVAVLLAATLPAGPTASAAAAVTPSAGAGPTTSTAKPSGGGFADPSATDRPLYRFWTTGGLMSPESARAQIAQIKASGAGGVEANQLTDVVEAAADYDPATMSWGNLSWTRAQTALLREGAAAGLRVDQIYTPGWSASTQTVSPDGPGSAKEITFGSTWLVSGQSMDGPVPTAPLLPDGVTKRDLQGVVAYRCESNCDGTGATVPVLDPDSAVDLTSRVSDGKVKWTAPSTPVGRYVVVGAWMNGTGQRVALAATPSPSYLVDHFAASGFGAVREYWEDEVLTPELREAMRDSGGSFFFDSLELNRDGQQVRSWTDDFLQQFQQRRGYSLAPYLAAVGVSTPVFDFTGDVGERIREDYNQTLSDLFRDYHLNPLKQWAANFGLTVRGQAYSSWGPSPVDTAEMATLLDIPEGEDLSFNSGFTGGYLTTQGSDVWRSLASAAAQTGGQRVSTECCALYGTFAVPRQTLLAHVNQQFSVGVNQIVWHGWADQSPGAANSWPGFSPFGFLISDVYGPQNPTFAEDKKVNDYVGRMQTVLRRGNLRNDVAIYRDDNGHSRDGSSGDLYFTDQSLANAGYTYGFMNNTLVNSPTATVKDGLLNPDRLGYQAFVLNNTDNPNTNPTLDLATAQRILSWAKAELPVVVVGDMPKRVRGNHPAQDAQLRAATTELLAQSTVTAVDSEPEVLAALRGAGVRPAAQYAKPAPLVSLHRQTSDSDYYHLFNSGDSVASTTVTLAGRGMPYRYDAWSGAVTPIAEYKRTDGGVEVGISLKPGDSTLIGVTRRNADTPKNACANSAIATTADAVVRGDDGNLAVRDTEAGTYTTSLSTGKTVTSTIANVAAPTTPSDWTLNVTSWEEGDGPNDTKKVAMDPIPLKTGLQGTLPDWLTVPGLQLKSGTAVYTTTIEIGESWTGGLGAYLDLGDVRGLASVKVNGRTLPTFNQIDANGIDLRGYLAPGTNTVEVHLSTLLGNAAYKGVPFGPKSYGLVGPVVIRPYGQVDITGRCATPR